MKNKLVAMSARLEHEKKLVDQLKTLNLPYFLLLFAYQIIKKDEAPEKLQQYAIGIINQLNINTGEVDWSQYRSAGKFDPELYRQNPPQTTINTFSDYIHLYRQMLPRDIADYLDNKLGLSIQGREPALRGDRSKLREVEIVAHKSSDLDTLTHSLFEAFLEWLSPSHRHLNASLVYQEQARQDAIDTVNYFLGIQSPQDNADVSNKAPSLFENLFRQKADWQYDVSELMRDRSQIKNQLITLQTRLDHIKIPDRHQNYYLENATGQFLGIITNEMIIRVESALNRAVENEARINRSAGETQGFYELLNMSIEPESIRSQLQNKKYLSMLTAHDLEQIREADVDTRHNLLKEIIRAKLTLGDMNIRPLPPDTMVHPNDPASVVAATLNPQDEKPVLIQLLRTTIDDADEDNQSTEARGYKLVGVINARDLHPDYQKPTSAVFNVDHQNVLPNLASNRPVDLRDHHMEKQAHVANNPYTYRNVQSAGSSTSLVVNEASRDLRRLPTGMLLLGVSAIANDTDDLNEAKVTQLDIDALSSLLRELTKRFQSGQADILVPYFSAVDTAELFAELDRIEGVDPQSGMKALKKIKLIQDVIQKTNDISLAYQVSLRDAANPDVYRFDAKTSGWNRQNVTDSIQSQGLDGKQGTAGVALSQEKHSLESARTLSEAGKMYNYDFDYQIMQQHFDRVKSKAQIMVHMISIMPEEIVGKDPAQLKAQGLRDVIEVYAPNWRNLYETVYALLNEKSNPLSDITAKRPYSIDEINVRIFFKEKNGDKQVNISNVADIAAISAISGYEKVFQQTAEGLQLRSDIKFTALFSFISELHSEGHVLLANDIADRINPFTVIELPAGTYFSRKKELAPRFK